MDKKFNVVAHYWNESKDAIAISNCDFSTYEIYIKLKIITEVVAAL
jgi:hypothetical protein